MSVHFSCLGSCCQESSSGRRPPSLTAVLRTKPKTTGWVLSPRACFTFTFTRTHLADDFIQRGLQVRDNTRFYSCALFLVYSGEHLDSDRPAGTWQSSPSVPGEVQVCCQVRTGQPVWVTDVHYLFTSEIKSKIGFYYGRNTTGTTYL